MEKEEKDVFFIPSFHTLLEISSTLPPPRFFFLSREGEREKSKGRRSVRGSIGAYYMGDEESITLPFPMFSFDFFFFF